MSLRDAKRAMREQLMAARDALDPALRAQASQAITARIAALDTFVRRAWSC